MRALFEIALKRNWAALANKTLDICKMVERRTWASQSPLRQFTAVPEVIVRKLEKNSDITWERYYDLKPQDLGEMVKIPKMGKTLHKYVHMFPKVDLSASVQPITRSLLKVEVVITPDFVFDPTVHDYTQLFWLLVEDVDGEKLLHYEAFSLKVSVCLYCIVLYCIVLASYCTYCSINFLSLYYCCCTTITLLLLYVYSINMLQKSISSHLLCP
jgi:pre-mRNA-splicing helicase BRR2